MSRYIAIQGFPNLLKDARTGAIINTDIKEHEEARKIKRLRMERKIELESMKNDVKDIKVEIQSIKEAIQSLIEFSKENK